MTAHDHTHAHRHRRERRARRQADHVLTAAVAAIGGGSSDDWPQDMPTEPLEGVQDARNGVGKYTAAQKGRKAPGARKSGVTE